MASFGAPGVLSVHTEATGDNDVVMQLQDCLYSNQLLLRVKVHIEDILLNKVQPTQQQKFKGPELMQAL